MSALVFQPVSAVSPDPVRGVTLRDAVIWMLYRRLARGDFHHDFGERTATRDLMVAGDENRFFEIAKNISTKGSVWLRTQFKDRFVGKTLFELLGNYFDQVLLPPLFKSTDNEFADENTLITAITGLPYDEIKRRAVAAEGANPSGNVNVNVAGVTRRYTVRSSSYRAGPRPPEGPANAVAWDLYKQNRNISSMFQEVTGKSRFALIVDATGGLSLTEILNASLSPPPSSSCQFYIIQNIENASDSADKVQHIKQRAGISPAASIFYLRDAVDNVVYPLWGPEELDQKSNLFASMQISLTRLMDGTVEADITAGPDTFHIGDVANASNVKNATLAAAAVMVEKGIVPEVFVYTLIKRMGDWCQALSLLDLDRKYTIRNQDQQDLPTTTTLRDMLVDTEIGVVTNDRILLAFCLLHGLNVFFTSAMDIARLIYFKNADDVPDGPRLTDRTVQLYANYVRDFEATKAATNELATGLLALVTAKVGEITATTELPEYLARVKAFTVIVSRLDSSAITPFDLQSDTADLVANNAIYINPDPAVIPRDKFSAVTKMVAILAKMNTRLTTGRKALAMLTSGEYPGKSVIDVRVAALATKLGQGRAPNSVPIVEARDTLVRVREDVELIVKNIPSLTESLQQIFNPTQLVLPDGRVGDNHREVLKGLDPTRLILGMSPTGVVLSGGGQRGGGPNIAAAYAALRTRMIRVLPPGYPEKTSTTNTYVQGDDYVDDKLRVYTVVDEYIVTKEDATTFDLFFADDGSQPIDPAQVEYICKRYMLLQFDMLRQNYEQFIDTFSRSDTRRGEDDAGFVAVDTDDPANVRAGTQHADNLATIRSTLHSIGSVLAAFTYANVKAYYGGAREPSGVDNIPSAFTECKQKFIGMFPFKPVALTEQAQQIIAQIDGQIEASRTYAAGGIVLLILTEINGFFRPLLSEEEKTTLSKTLEDAVIGGILSQVNTYDQPGDTPLVDWDKVGEYVRRQFYIWLLQAGRPEQGSAGVRIQNTIKMNGEVWLQRAVAAAAQAQQRQGGRKTHRRRLPKLI